MAILFSKNILQADVEVPPIFQETGHKMTNKSIITFVRDLFCYHFYFWIDKRYITFPLLYMNQEICGS